MSVTILGQHIRLIRPERPSKPLILKGEKRTKIARYYTKPKTIKEKTGKVIGVCICTLSGKVFELARGLHFHVCEHYGVNPKDVAKTGWKLDNGNYVWR
jgi:hypothetical protein